LYFSYASVRRHLLVVATVSPFLVLITTIWSPAMPMRRLFALLCLAVAVVIAVALVTKHRSGSGKLQVADQAKKLSPAKTQLTPRLASSLLAQLPLSFEENRGQFDARVKFLSRGAGYALFVSSGQATIVHKGMAHVTDGVDASSPLAALASSEVQTRSVTQLTWLGANPNAQPRGDGRPAGESNYLIGKDARKWRRHVQHYDRVRLPGLYPGIDLVYHGIQQQVELDYVIAPHADPKAIQIGISGPSLVSVDPRGQLSISSGGEELLLLPPVAYQEKDGRRETVNAKYVLAESHRVGFEVDAYDRSRPLVIDPVLVFAAEFGTSSNLTTATDVAVDPTGNIYVTGTTCDTNYPTTSGVFQPDGGNNLSNACNDAIVTKLNPTASELLYSTYIGGQTSVDFGSRLLVDGAGEVTVAGTTSSSDFPTTPGAYQTSLKSGVCNYSPNLAGQSCSDAFLLKLSADGSSLVYSTLFGGERVEIAMGLAQDSAGDSFISGSTNSTLLPVNSSSYSSTYGGGTACQGGQVPCFDGFIAKFNPIGSQLLASTYLGGNDDDFAAGVALDTSDNVYVTGSADSVNFPTTAGAYQTTHAGTTDNRDAFLSKFDTTLHTLQYSTFFGGTADDLSFYLRVDSSGAAYITGSTLSPDLTTTSGAYQRIYNGPAASTTNCGGTLDSSIVDQPTCGDIFVAKIDPSKTGAAQLVFSTYLGGSSNNFAYNLALDSQKNVWLIGDTNSTDFPLTPDAYFSNPSSLFLSEIKNDGTQLLFSTFLTKLASSGSLGLGIAIDPSDNVYVAGQGTVSPTPGAYVTGSDIFLMKFSPATARPGVQLSATTLTYGLPGTVAPLNSATAPQSVTLTNNGTATLHFAISLTVGGGNPLVFSESDNCGTSLAAAASCTINATYEPSSTGSSSTGFDGAVVNIMDDAPGAPHTITLNGRTGLGESASFVPASLTFNGQQPGIASAAQTSFLNASTSAANSLSAFVLGPAVVSGANASDFSVDTSSCGVGSAGCFLTVTFTPIGSTPATRTATVTVPSSAANSPQTLSLIGNVSTGPFGVFTPPFVNPTVVAMPINTSIVLKNTGGTTLTVTGVTPSGANPGDFVLSNTSGCTGYPTFSVAPQGVCLLNLKFTPAAVGTRTATFTFAGNQSPAPVLTLSGYGQASGGPELSLLTVPSLVNNQILYPDTVVGHSATFNIAIISLLNLGSGPSSGAHITSAVLAGDFALATTQTNPCPAPATALAGGGSCSYTVIFAPTAPGLRTGTLTISTDAPGQQPFTVNFVGTGVQIPSVAVTPPSITFGPQAVGTTSAPQSVTIANTGNGTLNFSNVAFSGAPFIKTTASTCGATLLAGSNCVYVFTFAPSAPGGGGGTLTAATNAAGGMLAIGVNGTGVTGPVPMAQPSSLSFGPQAIGTKSAAQTVTFSNVGDTAFTIAGVHASENFSETSTCPASLAAGANCTISVSFAPTTDTNTSTSAPFFPTGGNVFVTTSAPGSPFSIPLVGDATPSTGAGTNLVITSSANPSTVGQSVTFTATVTPVSGSVAPTGTVTFFDGGGSTQLGSPVTLSAKTTTFATTSLPLGINSITINYSGDATYAAENSSGFVQTVNAGTTAAQSFTLSAPSPATLSVVAGQNATPFTFTVSPQNNSTQTVTFSCSGLPVKASCMFQPASVTLDGTHTSAPVSATIVTTADTLVVPGRRLVPPADWTHFQRVLVLGLLALSIVLFHVRRRKIAWLVSTGVLLMVLTSITGCASGGSGSTTTFNGTPPGTSAVTVTGVAGSALATTPSSVTLTVTAH
jgi:VCBS repeat-containing protein